MAGNAAQTSSERPAKAELTAVLLRLRKKASAFWIVLLLVWADPEHLEPLTLNGD
jgi:hypothetical protein